MTKRKRTPTSSSPPGARVPFQIPASLQRLSMISRSLADQSNKLAGVGQDDQDARTSAQPQPSSVVRGGQEHGFRAFAPPQQPSFPDAQTWVEPTSRKTPLQVPDDTGFVPPRQPPFPQGQIWPQPRPPRVRPPPQPLPPAPVTPAPAQAQAPELPKQVPPVVPLEVALANLEDPPAEGETLCLATQPNRIAVLIAQKRAANEANCKREAWSRQAAAHRFLMQAPDDQLVQELNSALGQSSTGNKPPQKQTSRHPQQYVTPAVPITFDPVVPSTAYHAETETATQTKDALAGGEDQALRQTSAPPARSTVRASSHDHDSLNSLFSTSGLPSPSPTEPEKPGRGQDQVPGQDAGREDVLVAQPLAAASTAGSPPVDLNLIYNPSNNARHASTSWPNALFVHQPSNNNTVTPVAAGYYRFHPRDWPTSLPTQQQQPIQPFARPAQPAYQSIEGSAWSASYDVPHKGPVSSVFRNLTQDKFGSFGVDGKIKEPARQHSNHAGTKR